MLTDQNKQTIPAVPIGMKKAQQNVAGSMGSNPGAPGPQVSTEDKKKNKLQKPQKKLNLKLIIGAIILVLLLIGGGAGLYLSQMDQDVRQQASTGTGYTKPSPTSTTNPTTKPTTNPTTNPTTKPTTNPTTNPTTKPTEQPSPTPLAQCNDVCVTDSDCSNSDHSCYQPPMPECPDGMYCAQVMPAKVCRLTSNPTSTTCVEPTPTVGCNGLCVTDSDCSDSDHFCYQPPMPSCPVGSVCAQGMPAPVCRLTSNPESVTCDAVKSPSPTVGCNDVCVTDSDCSDSDHECSGGVCRLAENPGDQNCSPASPTPTTAPGCNEECYSSSECTNYSAVCYNNLCRLSTNPTDTACQPKQVVQQTGQYYEQPELPEQLPESGSEDILNWLKVGIGALGLGIIFLFL